MNCVYKVISNKNYFSFRHDADTNLMVPAVAPITGDPLNSSIWFTTSSTGFTNIFRKLFLLLFFVILFTCRVVAGQSTLTRRGQWASGTPDWGTSSTSTRPTTTARSSTTTTSGPTCRMTRGNRLMIGLMKWKVPISTMGRKWLEEVNKWMVTNKLLHWAK